MQCVKARVHRNAIRDHALFALIVNTGIRPSEALAVSRGDIRMGAHENTLRVKRLKSGPEDRFDTLVLTDGLAGLLRLRLRQIDQAPQSKLFPMGERQAQRVFHYYAHKAGITRRARLYILRHTAATRMYRSTRNIALVQAMLGHKSPDTTAIYAHIPGDVLRATAETLQGA